MLPQIMNADLAKLRFRERLLKHATSQVVAVERFAVAIRERSDS
jgi:hypothetical protein